MEGLGTLIFLCFAITFAPPVILFFVGLVKQKTNKASYKIFYILSALWLIIGGGICASILS